MAKCINNGNWPLQKPRIVAELLVFYGRCLENIDYITAYDSTTSHEERRQSKFWGWRYMELYQRSWDLTVWKGSSCQSCYLLQKGVLRGALFSVLCCLSHDLSLKISYTQPKESFTFLTSQGTLE